MASNLEVQSDPRDPDPQALQHRAGQNPHRLSAQLELIRAVCRINSGGFTKVYQTLFNDHKSFDRFIPANLSKFELVGVVRLNCWLELQVGVAGWSCRLELFIGIAGSNCSSELQVEIAS